MSVEPLFVTTRDGVRIAYAESGAGPPLIFVRGWISHLELLWEDPAFRAYMVALGRSFRVIRYDARGNGLSESPREGPTLDDLVLDLEALVEHLGVSDLVLYGTAFGGPIAASFAAAHPKQVRRLILGGTFSTGSEITSRARQRIITLALRFFPEMAFLLLGHATHPEGQASSYRRPAFVHKMISPAVAARLYTMAFRLDLRDVLPRISSPTLVLHRRDSQSIPLRLGREVATLIPDAHLVVLDGRPHNDWEGDAGQALDAIAAFLDVPLKIETAGEPAGSDWTSAETQGTDRYALIRPVSEGSMAEVHQATDQRLNRSVAVKFLPEALADDPDSLARFRQEVSVIASLNHPNICTIHDVDTYGGRPCMVMELLQGRSLRDVIRDGPVPLARLIDWSVEVCDALGAAHAKGIIHRDVKSSNIFVTDHGEAKILDFGIAKVTQPALSGDATEVSLTQSGALIGTLAYMSPEQAGGEELDARTDIFSLGIVMFEMAVGRRPFTGRTGVAVMARILTHDPVPPIELDSEIPERLNALILRALEKDPDLRPPSAHALMNELLDLRGRTSHA